MVLHTFHSPWNALDNVVINSYYLYTMVWLWRETVYIPASWRGMTDYWHAHGSHCAAAVDCEDDSRCNISHHNVMSNIMHMCTIPDKHCLSLPNLHSCHSNYYKVTHKNWNIQAIKTVSETIIPYHCSDNVEHLSTLYNCSPMQTTYISLFCAITQHQF